MAQYCYLLYFYTSLGKKLKPEQLFPGENILYKCEKMNYEDEKYGYSENANVYLTNFRLLILTNEYCIYDIPLMFIEKYEIHKPYFFNIFTPNYIQITIPKIIKLSQKCPQYIYDNYLLTDIKEISIIYPLYVKLIFKPEHNIDEAYEFIKRAIELKDYLKSFIKKNKENDIENKILQKAFSVKQMGLGLERVENLQKSKILYDSMLINNSFTGINNLRENAEKLISLAQEIRVKLNSKTNGNNNNQILDINKILSKIGFIDPVTREVSGSDYYYELANQINEFFYNYFEKNKEIKVITLIDAYTIYNRARGANTISPKDMKIAINYLNKKFKDKIFVKNFNNEIIVLHNKEFSTSNIILLIEKFMNENKQDYIDINDLSKIINVKNIILEKILIDDLLINGNLLLDENDLEVKYYLNTILNYNI